jgi:hypothetical protein
MALSALIFAGSRREARTSPILTLLSTGSRLPADLIVSPLAIGYIQTGTAIFLALLGGEHE